MNMTTTSGTIDGRNGGVMGRWWSRLLFALLLAALSLSSMAFLGQSLFTVASTNTVPGCPNIQRYGGVPDGATDVSIALTSAFAAAPVDHPCAYAPAGKYKITSTSGYTYSYNGDPVVSLTLVGDGADVTELIGAAGQSSGCLLTLNLNGQGNSYHVRNLAIEAPNVNTVNGLCVQQTAASITNPANTAQSDVIGVTFRGSDGYSATNVWKCGFSTNYVSEINFINDAFFGTASGASGTPVSGTDGICLNGGTSAATQEGVQYNVVASLFAGLDNGILYGPYIQGLVVGGGTNFVDNNIGVLAPAGAAAPSQLTVTDSECSNWVACVEDLSGVAFVRYADNVVFINTSGYGFLSEALYTEVHHNATWSIGAGTIPINIPAGTYGEVTDNIIGANGVVVPAGIALAAATSGVRVAGNKLALRNGGTVTHMVANSNTSTVIASNNTILGIEPPGAFSAVSAGAASGGSPNLLRLTVGSTASFVTGEWVSVGGIVWTGGNMPSNFQSPVVVVSATQLDVMAVPWTGTSTYSSGGVVSAMP
jgi:hypothetical protein